MHSVVYWCNMLSSCDVWPLIFTKRKAEFVNSSLSWKITAICFQTFLCFMFSFFICWLCSGATTIAIMLAPWYHYIALHFVLCNISSLAIGGIRNVALNLSTWYFNWASKRANYWQNKATAHGKFDEHTVDM